MALPKAEAGPVPFHPECSGFLNLSPRLPAAGQAQRAALPGAIPHGTQTGRCSTASTFVLVSSQALLVFLLPADSGEKISMGTTHGARCPWVRHQVSMGTTPGLHGYDTRSPWVRHTEPGLHGYDTRSQVSMGTTHGARSPWVRHTEPGLHGYDTRSQVSMGTTHGARSPWVRHTEPGHHGYDTLSQVSMGTTQSQVSKYHGHTRLLHERQEYCWSRRASMVLEVKWTGAGHHGGAKCGWTSRPRPSRRPRAPRRPQAPRRPRGPHETPGDPGAPRRPRGPQETPGDPGAPRRLGPEHQTQQSKVGPGFTILIQTLKDKVLHDADKQSRHCPVDGVQLESLPEPERLPPRL
ncbi:unnamed protein product [Arctogadus glacialis]